MIRPMLLVFALGGIFGCPSLSNAQTHKHKPHKIELKLKKKDEERIASELEHSVSANVRCLAQVIYYEIRGGGAKSRVAVAQTVMHRVGDPEFGKTTCEVIHRKDYSKAAHKWVYQYPWSKNFPRKTEPNLWIESLQLASALMDPDSGIEDLVTIKTPNGNMIGTYFNDAIYKIKLDNNLIRIGTYDGMAIYAKKPNKETQVAEIPDK